MLKFIRSWPPLIEALIVVLGAFGYPTALGVLSAFQPVKIDVSVGAVFATGLYELVALLLLCSFLYLRGWDTKRFGLNPERPDPLIAVALAGAIWLLVIFLYDLGQLLGLVPKDTEEFKFALNSMSSVVLAALYSFVDAAFEELFLCGYLITLAKEHKHLALGITASLAVRIAYYLEHGAFGVITAIALGLVYVGWYVRTGRLWPVILGHALIQLLSFALSA